jgi:hypothetical protein
MANQRCCNEGNSGSSHWQTIGLSITSTSGTTKATTYGKGVAAGGMIAGIWNFEFSAAL